jgi:CCR4-NOT transcription complex subunit 1
MDLEKTSGARLVGCVTALHSFAQIWPQLLVEHAISLERPQRTTSSAQSLYKSNSVTRFIVTQAKAATSATSKTPSNTVMSTKSIKSIANAKNIDTLLVANETETEKINLPPDSVQDKTAFIFNNLSQLNLTSKCEEVKEILIKEYYPWMSQYLVLKRASIEINFHTLYSNFLDALKMPELLILTTNETFRNIKVLL